MSKIKVTVRDGRAGRDQAAVTPEGWGAVLAEFEKDLPPFDEGDVLQLGDGTKVVVIGSEEAYYPDRVEQTVHIGTLPGPG